MAETFYHPWRVHAASATFVVGNLLALPRHPPMAFPAPHAGWTNLVVLIDRVGAYPRHPWLS